MASSLWGPRNLHDAIGFERELAAVAATMPPDYERDALQNERTRLKLRQAFRRGRSARSSRSCCRKLPCRAPWKGSVVSTISSSILLRAIRAARSASVTWAGAAHRCGHAG